MTLASKLSWAFDPDQSFAVMEFDLDHTLRRGELECASLILIVRVLVAEKRQGRNRLPGLIL
jgi:hypothetical protein